MYSEICFHFHIDTRIETFSSRRQRILFSYFVHNFNFVALLSENVCFLFIHLEKTVVSLVVQDMIRVGVHEYWKNTFYIFMEENLIYNTSTLLFQSSVYLFFSLHLIVD